MDQDKKQKIEKVMNEVTGKQSKPGSGRPGGNPDFGKKIGFKAPEGQEPNSAQLFLRVKPSLLNKVKSLDNWQDVVREKLEELVKDVLDA